MLRKGRCSEKPVHFRNHLRQFLRITLRQAAENENTGDLSPVLPVNRIEDSRNRLLLCIVDKGTGIQHDRIARLIAVFGKDFKRSRLQLPHKVLGIHTVLGTAERYHLYTTAHPLFRNQKRRSAL